MKSSWIHMLLFSHLELSDSVIPWTAACQTPLFSITSQSLLKLMSIELVINPFSFCLQPFPAAGSFPVSQLFASGGQSIGASALVSVFPMNIQGWFHFELPGLISLLSKRFLRVFFSTTIWKHHFFGAQPSSWSNSHTIHNYWENHSFDYTDPLSAKWYLCFLICCLGLS